jgi:hypothetical protein
VGSVLFPGRKKELTPFIACRSGPVKKPEPPRQRLQSAVRAGKTGQGMMRCFGAGLR